MTEESRPIGVDRPVRMNRKEAREVLPEELRDTAEAAL